MRSQLAARTAARSWSRFFLEQEIVDLRLQLIALDRRDELLERAERSSADCVQMINPNQIPIWLIHDAPPVCDEVMLDCRPASRARPW
jgi:hypothetical protein